VRSQGERIRTAVDPERGWTVDPERGWTVDPERRWIVAGHPPIVSLRCVRAQVWLRLVGLDDTVISEFATASTFDLPTAEAALDSIDRQLCFMLDDHKRRSGSAASRVIQYLKMPAANDLSGFSTKTRNAIEALADRVITLRDGEARLRDEERRNGRYKRKVRSEIHRANSPVKRRRARMEDTSESTDDQSDDESESQ
jgi:hypothetical protein